MEEQTLRSDFAAKLSFARELLRTRLSGASGAPPAIEDDSGLGAQGAGAVMEDLFATGLALGLTDKELTRQLLLPVAELIRPGLAR